MHKQYLGSRAKSALSFLLLLVLLAIATCQGGGIQEFTDIGTAPVVTETPGSNIDLDPTQDLPQLPADPAGEPSRSASNFESLFGSDALSHYGGWVDGEGLHLSGEGGMAWAMYQFNGMSGRLIDSIELKVAPGTLGSECTVGIGNFDRESWEWKATSGLPEFNCDLQDEISQIVSNLGNMYICLVAYGESDITVNRLDVLSHVPASGYTTDPYITVICENDRVLVESDQFIRKVKLICENGDEHRFYDLGYTADLYCPNGDIVDAAYVKAGYMEVYKVFDNLDCGPRDQGSPCDGKVTKLTLRWDGSGSAQIKVKQKKDNIYVFDGTVDEGDTFSFEGEDKNGTLGTEIIIEYDGSSQAIHTSCSQPIARGMSFGPFYIVDGYSLKGGRLPSV